ncbi:hypothetical protein GCM10020000_47550 [Streptomyces olivoverticillatus]
MRGPGNPPAQFGVAVTMFEKGAVVDGVGARVDQHFVEAVQRQHVEFAFPVVPAVVRARVAVVGVVEDEAVGHVRLAGERGADGREALGQLGLLARPGEVGVRHVSEVPVQAGELDGRCAALHGDAAALPGHAEGIGAARAAHGAEGDLTVVAGQQPGQRGRGGSRFARGGQGFGGGDACRPQGGRPGEGTEERATGDVHE